MRRLLLFVLAASFVLGGLELVTRVLVLPNERIVWRPLPPFGAFTNDGQREWVARQRSELAGASKPTGVGCFDADLGWSYRPSSRTADGKIHINARGARSLREYEGTPPEGVLRVVACGDSFTFCEEVSDAESWPALLEAELPRVEVLNFGVGGYGTDQALLRLRSVDAGTGVDAVIVGLLLENIGRNVNRYRPRWYPRADTPVVKPRFVLSGDGLELVPSPYATRAALLDAVESGRVLVDLSEHEYWGPGLTPAFSWFGLARLLAAERAYGARSLETLWSDTEAEPFQVTLRLLQTFANEAKARGAGAFLVVVFPTQADLQALTGGGGRYWQTLLDGLTSSGIEALDLSIVLEEPYRSQGSAEEPLFGGSHLSARGNALVSRSVGDWLRGVRRRKGQ